MAILAGPPPRPPFPSGRYTRSNPLRREAGLRLLTAALPEPLRRVIVTTWRRPSLFNGEQTPLAVQSGLRQRPGEAQLAQATFQTTCVFILTELEVTRRVLEAPLASISRMTRNTLLVAQGAYLRLLFAALVVQLGSIEAALAEFQRLIVGVG
ncbi:MAG TPA: hypothetical protein VH599_15645 [Ktedonobacterales bacterium]|jgi:hypothetical protein